MPTEERWAEFNQLAQLMPNPPANWREKAKPCKYQAILDERRQRKR